MGTIAYVHTLDVADYNRLRTSVGWDAIPEKQACAGLAHSAWIVAAKDAKQTVGMARLVTDHGYVAYIADVVVSPDHQGRGIGKALLERALQFIKDQMEDGEQMMVFLLAAKGREPFYRPFGFLDRPNDAHGAGMSMWLKK